MSITAIQQTNSLYDIFGTSSRSGAEIVTPVSPTPKRDTVTFSEEALALIEKMRKAKAEEDAKAQNTVWENSARAEELARTQEPSQKEAGLSLFAMMLESLFMADLEENSQATAQAAEGDVPPKRANPLDDSAKATGIKKLMKDVASGKADISDIPIAMAAGGVGRQSASPVTKQASEKVAAETSA